jgi:hypothetical protein
MSRLERGDSEPSWTTVRLLARALGAPVSAFEVGELPLPEAGTVKPRGRPRKQAAPPKRGRRKGKGQ